MRVTNKMLSNNFLSDMRTNLGNMKTIQQQLSSGKEIRKPSDDPFKVARAMQLHSDISANEQYNNNIKETTNWLDTTDTALGQVGTVLQRVRELMVSAGNAGYSQNERNAIKDEINTKVGELAQTMNTSFDGQYIFGGTRGTAKPVGDLEDTSNTNGNRMLSFVDKSGINAIATNPAAGTTDAKEIAKIGSKVSVEISQGVTMEYNVGATDIIKYGNDASQNLSDLLKRVVNHLDGNNDTGTAVDSSAVTKITNEDLQGMTDAISNVLKIRSEVGAKQNRMESALDKNTDETYNMTEILSKTEDIDITEKTMQYANMQTVYLASLQTSAKVLQPSLMDYLR